MLLEVSTADRSSIEIRGISGWGKPSEKSLRQVEERNYNHRLKERWVRKRAAHRSAA